LAQMASQEMPFEYSKDARSGRVIIKVADDLHLDMIGENLKRTHMLEVSVGAPKVAYRETLARPTEIDYTHRKQTGGTGQFARVKLRLEPNDRDAGNQFESVIVGGVVPKEFIPGVERGAWRSGRMGFPMVDTRVTLLDGAYREIDSSAVAFEIAASTAMRNGATSADVRLLEPIMEIEVVSPGDFIASVIGDLNRRRGPDQ
jgi:elongation factor G